MRCQLVESVDPPLFLWNQVTRTFFDSAYANPTHAEPTHGFPAVRITTDTYESIVRVYPTSLSLDSFSRSAIETSPI